MRTGYITCIKTEKIQSKSFQRMSKIIIRILATNKLDRHKSNYKHELIKQITEEKKMWTS